MGLFTERHGMRTPITKTTIISGEMFALLFDCCSKYYDNIAWRYPEECPDGNGCSGLDHAKMDVDMKYRIPSLYRTDYNGSFSKPSKSYGGAYDDFDQFALLDYVEFFAQNIKDISSRYWHDFFRHNDLTFADSAHIFSEFQKDINEIFELTGLLYSLTNDKIIERVTEYGVITSEVVKILQSTSESGIRELLNEAVAFHKMRGPSARKIAVEKIWDAFERIKTFYPTHAQNEKKASVEKVTDEMSNGQSELKILFEAEFKALTEIGNKFRIRHHETYVTDIKDERHHDYFFNRCLSLIDLAIQVLESKKNQAVLIEDDDLPF